MDVHFPARDRISPDAMTAAAAHVEREYGPTGYLIGVAYGGTHTAVFEVSHFDGSRFNIVADKWGNVTRIPDDVTEDEARGLIGDAAYAAASAGL